MLFIVEVCFDYLIVNVEVYVGDRVFFFLINFMWDLFEDVLVLCGIFLFIKCFFIILWEVSGVLKLGRMILFLGLFGNYYVYYF